MKNYDIFFKGNIQFKQYSEECLGIKNFSCIKTELKRFLNHFMQLNDKITFYLIKKNVNVISD